MNRKNPVRYAANLLSKSPIVAMGEEALDSLMSSITSGEIEADEVLQNVKALNGFTTYNTDANGWGATYCRNSNTTVIPIEGTIIPSGDYFCGYTAGLDDYTNIIEQSQKDGFNKVILSIDSPGGSVYGLETFANFIQAKRGEGMQIYAFVKSMACSAAYYIASQCDSITLSESATIVGNVGVLMRVRSITEYLATQGIRDYTVTSTKSVNKLLVKDADNVEQTTQSLRLSLLDPMCESFIQAVKTGRGEKLNTNDTEQVGSIEVPKIFTGAIYLGKAAVKAGLADSIENNFNLYSKNISKIKMAFGYIKESEVDAMKGEHQAEIDALNSGHKAALDALNASLTAANDTISAQNAALESKDLELNAALEAGQKVTDLQGKITELEAAVNNHKADIDAKATYIATLEAATANLPTLKVSPVETTKTKTKATVNQFLK